MQKNAKSKANFINEKAGATPPFRLFLIAYSASNFFKAAMNLSAFGDGID